MEPNNEQTTLRDSLEQAFDEVQSGTPQDTPPVDAKDAPAAEPKKDEAPKPGRTAGRARDEAGRLLPGKAERQEKEPEAKSAAAVPSAPAAPERKPIRLRDKDVEWWKLPSTWKKDAAEHWEKTPEAVMQEIHRRESDAAFGVSTYKTEYDRLKPIHEALAPFQPFMQQAGIRPDQFVAALARSDQTLRYGTPEQKLSTFARLAQDYQIPLHQLLVQAEDGKVYLNQQYFQQQQQKDAAQGLTAPEVERIVQKRLQDQYWINAIQGFVAAKDTDGNPLYPHFETVRPTMDGILRAGLAKDLPTAYAAALRMPQHADLFEAQQNAKREADEKAKLQAKQHVAAKARDAAVSVKSQSPTGKVEPAKPGHTSIRDSLEDAFSQHEGGRV